MSWLKNLFFKAMGKRRELVYVTYAEANRMLVDPDLGWHVAPEEDRNLVVGMVYLERWQDK